MMKKQFKIWQRNLARSTMVFFFGLINWLPYGFIKTVMRIFFWIAFHLTFKLKSIARETLTLALGQEKTGREIDEIIKGCFHELGEGMMELLYYSRFPERFKDKVVFEGKEHLEHALAQGRGAIAVTAHFGNFPLMMMALVQCGYPVHVIMRPVRDPKAAEIITKIMTKVGVGYIFSMPRKECVNSSLRALRNNEILFILMDQNFGGEGGVFVDFFGRKAATASGAVVFAARTDSPIIPMFNIREGGRYRIFVESEMKLERREDYDEMLLVNVSRLTAIIERYIRKYPVHWGWMHRRFKSQAPKLRDLVPGT